MLLRRTRRSTHNICGALVNVHYDTHCCCLGKGKARHFQVTLDQPISANLNNNVVEVYQG
jgi:hypothetical protein